MTKKVLISYGTRYGATGTTAEEIAKVLKGDGLEVTLINTGKEKVKDIAPYDLVIVGSGMQMGKWAGSAEEFLKKYSKELSGKKLAIFVSSAALAIAEKDAIQEETMKMRKQYLEDKAIKYDLHPIALEIFGGVWDYNKMNFLFKRTLSGFKPKLQRAGIVEVQPGVYDTRNWDEIRAWAKKLAAQL